MQLLHTYFGKLLGIVPECFAKGLFGKIILTNSVLFQLKVVAFIKKLPLNG